MPFQKQLEWHFLSFDIRHLLSPKFLPDGTELLRHVRIGHRTGNIHCPSGISGRYSPSRSSSYSIRWRPWSINAGSMKPPKPLGQWMSPVRWPMRMCRSSSVPSDRSCEDRGCRIAKDKKYRSSCFGNGISLNLLTHGSQPYFSNILPGHLSEKKNKKSEPFSH